VVSPPLVKIVAASGYLQDKNCTKINFRARTLLGELTALRDPLAGGEAARYPSAHYNPTSPPCLGPSDLAILCPLNANPGDATASHSC